MSSRATKARKPAKSPRTPKASRGRPAAAKKAPQRTPRCTPKNVTDLCLDILRKIETPSSSASSLPASLTQDEKNEWIQSYINSITPNRVDYSKKSPTRQIITKLPRNTIFEVKEDPKLKKLMEKFKEPPPKIVERIDYDKDLQKAEETPKATDEGSSSLVAQASEGTDETNVIAPTMTYDEFVTKEEEKPNNSGSGTDLNDPKPGTSKDVNSSDEVSAVQSDTEPVSFVTERTPARKRHQADVIEIDDNSDLDDSIQIVKVIPPKKRGRIPQKVPETIQVLDSSAEKEEEDPSKAGLGECPICIEKLTASKGISATYCGHIYCTPCIRSSLKGKKSCPKCRKHLTLKKIHPLYV